MEFLLALQFLTMLPLTVRSPVKPKNLSRAMAFFPSVGLLLGLFAAGVHKAAALIFADSVCNLIAIVFLVLITGNLHGDGLMDSADGLFSGRPRAGMLEIMKDSRVGSHGVMAGCIVFLSKFVLLNGIPAGAQAIALVLMPVAGRWALVYGARVYQYARPGGGTGSFTDEVGNRELVWASLTVLIIVFILLGAYMWGQGESIRPVIINWLLLVGGIAAGTVALGWYIAGKIGGMTGDTLGAMNECIEVLALILLSAILA